MSAFPEVKGSSLLGLDYLAGQAAKIQFASLEAALGCPEPDLNQIKTIVEKTTSNILKSQATDYNEKDWGKLNSQLTRLVEMGMEFNDIIREKDWGKLEDAKSIMFLFIKGANHKSFTEQKIAVLTGDPKLKQERLEKAQKAIEISGQWAKDYNLKKEWFKNLNDSALTERTRALNLLPQEPEKALSILLAQAFNFAQIIETAVELEGNDVDGLLIDYYNNGGVMLTDAAELMLSYPQIEEETDIDFESCIGKAQKALKTANEKISKIKDLNSIPMKYRTVMVTSNLAYTYLLRCRYMLNHERPLTALLTQNLMFFADNFSLATQVLMANKNIKDMNDFFRSEIYCRGSMGLHVLAQMTKDGLTIIPQFLTVKDQLINTLSKFTGYSPAYKDLSGIRKYAVLLMSQIRAEDEDDRLLQIKVAQLLSMLYMR